MQRYTVLLNLRHRQKMMSGSTSACDAVRGGSNPPSHLIYAMMEKAMKQPLTVKIEIVLSDISRCNPIDELESYLHELLLDLASIRCDGLTIKQGSYVELSDCRGNRIGDLEVK